MLRSVTNFSVQSYAFFNPFYALTVMLLCLGPRGVGKTALLERLKCVELSEEHSHDSMPVTVPTVGTTLTSISVGVVGNHWLKKPSSVTLCVRELGGVMAPIWSKYYGTGDAIKGVLFVVDASNPRQVSAGSVLLLSALSDKQLRNTPFLVVLNKIDACEAPWSATQLRFLMRLSDVAVNADQDVDVIEASYKNEGSLKEIKEWMNKCHNSSK